MDGHLLLAYNYHLSSGSANTSSKYNLIHIITKSLYLKYIITIYKTYYMITKILQNLIRAIAIIYLSSCLRPRQWARRGLASRMKKDCRIQHGARATLPGHLPSHLAKQQSYVMRYICHHHHRVRECLWHERWWRCLRRWCRRRRRCRRDDGHG